MPYTLTNLLIEILKQDFKKKILQREKKKKHLQTGFAAIERWASGND